MQRVTCNTKSHGHTGGYSILCEYCSKLSSTATSNLGKKKINRLFIIRCDIFKHIWSDKEIDQSYNKMKIYEKNPEIAFIAACVKEFRSIYKQKSITLLHTFIEKYRKSSISISALLPMG